MKWYDLGIPEKMLDCFYNTARNIRDSIVYATSRMLFHWIESGANARVSFPIMRNVAKDTRRGQVSRRSECKNDY